MVNYIVEELLDLDTQPKLESPVDEHFQGRGQSDIECQKVTLNAGNRGLAWDFPVKDVFEVLGYRFHRDGKGFQGADRTLCDGLASWWQDRYIYRLNSVHL